MAHLTSIATKTKRCEGLVRNKATKGLRFPAEAFDDAWREIHGDRPAPSGVLIQHMFRLEPVPHGTTSNMLAQWADVIGWQFCAIKALGPRCWLIGSQTMPPSGLLTFNSQPVLVKLIPTKNSMSVSPILVGPKPSAGKQLKPQDDPHGPYFDPCKELHGCWPCCVPQPAGSH